MMSQVLPRSMILRAQVREPAASRRTWMPGYFLVNAAEICLNGIDREPAWKIIRFPAGWAEAMPEIDTGTMAVKTVSKRYTADLAKFFPVVDCTDLFMRWSVQSLVMTLVTMQVQHTGEGKLRACSCQSLSLCRGAGTSRRQKQVVRWAGKGKTMPEQNIDSVPAWKGGSDYLIAR